MKIEVNVTEVELNTVVERDYDGDPTTLGDKVAAGLVRHILSSDNWPPLRERINSIRDEEIRALVIPAITEVFATPIQRTNNWGDPVGGATTLREVVISEARKILDGTKDNGYGRGQEPLARQLIREMVEKELRAELVAAIKEEREKVVAAVREQAGDLIAEAVKRGVAGR